MTLTTLKGNHDRATSAPLSWRQLAVRFLGAMWGVVASGMMIGMGWASGVGSLWTELPHWLAGSLAVASVAGWVPLGFYYEGHRGRWIYIVGLYGMAFVLTILVGYSLGGALR